MKKTILVIGAGPGVGYATAERFGIEGYNVALVARNRERLESLKSELQEKGINAEIFPADVTNHDELTSAISSAKKHFGSIDVMEFGLTPAFDLMSTPRNMTVDNEKYILNLLVLSAIDVVNAVLPDMLERKEGSLLFTIPASAQKPVTFTASVGVALGALLNYIRVLHTDLKADNIYVGEVSVSGLIDKGSHGMTEGANKFPPGVSIVKASDIAEKLWSMNKQRNVCEVLMGNVAELGSTIK